MSISYFRYLLLSGIIVFAVSGFPLRVLADGVQYIRQMDGRAALHAVIVDLRDPWVQVTPAVAEDEPNHRLSFHDFMDEVSAIGAMHRHVLRFSQRPGHRRYLIDGQLIPFRTRMGTALAITPTNKAFMFDADPSRWHDWSGYVTVMQGGVRLLRHGIVDIDPHGQGFHDRYMCRCTHRIAVGIMTDGRVMLLGTFDNLLLPRLASSCARWAAGMPWRWTAEGLPHSPIMASAC